MVEILKEGKAKVENYLKEKEELEAKYKDDLEEIKEEIFGTAELSHYGILIPLINNQIEFHEIMEGEQARNYDGYEDEKKGGYTIYIFTKEDFEDENEEINFSTKQEAESFIRNSELEYKKELEYTLGEVK